eukprot:gene6564-10727_t
MLSKTTFAVLCVMFCLALSGSTSCVSGEVVALDTLNSEFETLGTTQSIISSTSTSEIKEEQKTCSECSKHAVENEAKGIPYCQVTCSNICPGSNNDGRYLIRVQKSIFNIRFINRWIGGSYKRCKKSSAKNGIKSCVCSYMLKGFRIPFVQRNLLQDAIYKTCNCRGVVKKKRFRFRLRKGLFGARTLETKAKQLEEKAKQLEESAKTLEVE